MSAIDSRTEYTFWSLWSAPLLVATDVRNMCTLTKEKSEDFHRDLAASTAHI